MAIAAALALEKHGTLNMTVVAPNDHADVGDIIFYTFEVKNTGNAMLTNVTVSDLVGGVTITGTPIASLAPGESNNWAYTGTYALTQNDIDAGTFTNWATATGKDPDDNDVTATDDETVDLAAVAIPSLTFWGSMALVLLFCAAMVWMIRRNRTRRIGT